MEPRRAAFKPLPRLSREELSSSPGSSPFLGSSCLRILNDVELTRRDEFHIYYVTCRKLFAKILLRLSEENQRRRRRSKRGKSQTLVYNFPRCYFSIMREKRGDLFRKIFPYILQYVKKNCLIWIFTHTNTSRCFEPPIDFVCWRTLIKFNFNFSLVQTTYRWSIYELVQVEWRCRSWTFRMSPSGEGSFHQMHRRSTKFAGETSKSILL